MAGKFFKIPFASTGDKTTVPDSVQADGSVSYSEGFGFDYERPDTDPDYKPVPRDQTNQIYGDITEAIGIIQAQGLADWDAAGAPYPAASMVRHSGTNWISISGNNSQTPGAAGSTNWRAFGGNPSETIAGFMRSATQAETDAGTLDNVSVTPKKLRFGFAASISQNGYLRLPSWMGGLMIQWGRASVIPGEVGTIPFPTEFPTQCFVVVALDISATPLSPNHETRNMVAYLQSRTQFQIVMDGTGSANMFSYIAIGR